MRGSFLVIAFIVLKEKKKSDNSHDLKNQNLKEKAIFDSHLISPNFMDEKTGFKLLKNTLNSKLE